MTKTAIADNGEILTGRAATLRRYYEKNREKKLAQTKEWMDRNPERVAAYTEKHSQIDKQLRKEAKRIRIEVKRAMEILVPPKSTDLKKEAEALRMREYRAKNKDKMNAYIREYRKKNPERVRALEKKSKLKTPFKEYVRGHLENAVRSGVLIRPETCDQCKSLCKPSGHHDSYDKPLEVRWLCSVCHAEADRARRAQLVA